MNQKIIRLIISIIISPVYIPIAGLLFSLLGFVCILGSLLLTGSSLAYIVAPIFNDINKNEIIETIKSSSMMVLTPLLGFLGLYLFVKNGNVSTLFLSEGD